MLLLKSHPDVFQESHDKIQANERTRLIVEAYQTLKSAGFPRLSSAASEQTSTAASERAWQPQHDEGDEEFDRWERAVFEAMYAGSVKRSGHAATLATTLWVGVWGLGWGVALLASGIVILVAPAAQRHIGEGVGLTVVGLIASAFAFRYMASPAFYYRQRDQRRFSLQQWPSAARWTLLVPAAIGAYLLGTFVGGLPGQILGLPGKPLGLLFRSDFGTVSGILAYFVGPALMVTAVRCVAPRFKRVTGFAAAGCASLFAIVLLRIEYIAGAPYLPQLSIYTAASIVGSLAGLMPKLREHEVIGAASLLLE